MRLIKGLLFLVLLIAVLGAIGVVVLRVGRGKFDPPTTVKPNVVAVANGGGVYLFAARAGARVVLFDTGIDPNGAPIDAELTDLKATRADVSDVFLTHGHGDHIAGAGALPKAKIHLGAGDVAMAAGKEPPNFLLAKLMAKALPAPPVTATNPLTGAVTVDLGEGKAVKAYPVPGHTPGSYVFLYDGVLFVGDIMVFKQGQLEPPARFFDPHPDENKAAVRSLKTQLASETVDTVCTAHGGCTPKGLGRTLLDELISRM